MKNKKLVIILTSMMVLIGGILYVNQIYNKSKNKHIPKRNNLAIMVKDESGEYISSDAIPKGNYILNEDKTICENNGKVLNYDSTTGKVSFSFVGSDRCSLYFDKIIDTEKPVISNLSVNDTTVTATLTDNMELSGYGISTSNSTEPTSWTTISGTTYNLSTTITTEGTYYLWVKDSAGNKAVSTVIDLEKKGWQTILANNTVNETTPDFSKVATTNEGMYAADDDYTATTGMKSYYFRGAVDNNWVKFGKDSNGEDIYWRIIRINGDGSIRMIYTGTTAPMESTKVVMTGTGTQIGTGKFNSNYNKAQYVGYMYTEGQQHGNSTPSTIKQAIENWYAGTTLKDNALISQDQIFCNDRSASSVGASYYYSAYERLNSNKKPILTCPEESDKFTSKGGSIGNKTLEYPVGLITADEVAMAGGKWATGNSSYYLYTNQNYWLGSPSYFSSGTYADEFYVNSSGYLYYNSGVNSLYGARPVVSLSSKAKLSGSGTYNDVYTVVDGNSTEDTSSSKSFDTVFAANNTDIFPENGLRYEGADPNNYICLDNKTSGTCSDSSLLFRIIGLFDEDTSSNGTSSSGSKKLLKVIDTNNYGGTSGKYWNQTQTSGKNYNDWSTATLKTELNDLYLRTLLATSGVNSKLSSGIANAKWHLGGASSSNYQTLTTEGIYTEERNTSAIYSGNPASLYAKIGLMYPSDYGYATVGGTTTNKSSCRAKALYNWSDSSFSDCKNNDWLFTSQNSFVNYAEWLLSPNSSYSSSAAYLNSSGSVSPYGYNSVANGKFAVRPTFYLDSSVLKIVGTGDGTKDNAYRVG